MRRGRFIYCFSLLAVLVPAMEAMAGPVVTEAATNRVYGVMEPALVEIAYAGTEIFSYEIAFTGGIKLGELDLEIRAVADKADIFEIYALVTTEDSVLNAIYPVRDIHLTNVRGVDRFPFSYEVWQKEGYNYRAHRFTTYDQEQGVVSYTKNDKAPVAYKVDPPVHNEFSAFFASRLMPLTPGSSFLVPTFADKRRSEVEVRVMAKEHFEETVLGVVDTFKVSPILKFKGLYDKRGDTTIWYTADECRVPVKITSKLKIGSVTATLLSYENPLCSRYDKSGQLVKVNITSNTQGKAVN
ncbi:Protein of unknown function [Desulfopila aestuarii DSM 18488]|uniref:DUF3108 domain-containing protein n=2 Tax=Desulfopila aestuarii TaxID=231440 RepID=A0A1M7YDD2_9BACT|nr:Protein of unknown function [Desulfopila aestuarii DSM 18488]